MPPLALAQQLIADRRFFHSIAEPGWLEFRTSLEIAIRLLDLGWSIQLGKALHTEDRLALPSDDNMEHYWSRSGIDRSKLTELFSQIQQRTTAPDKRAGNHAIQTPIDDRVLDEILDSYTGVIADWDSGQAGPSLLFRFDIDALAIAESQAENHRPAKENFVQTNGQACHACAHDGHIALGLGLARLIAANPNFKGKLRLVFQPAEESCRGAYSMVNKGLADGVDYMFACHLGLGMPSGKIGLATRGFLASQKFMLAIQGQAAHAASAPETGKNALLAAASLALNLHTLTQYGHSKAYLNVGRLEAGQLPNVIPESAQMEVEIRATDAKTMQDLESKMKTLVQGNCQARELSYQLTREGYAEALDPSYCDAYAQAGAQLVPVLSKLGFQTEVCPDFAASEDVVTWMNQVLHQGGQVMHFMLGTHTATAHHHPAFDFDDQDLLPALQALCASAEALTGVSLQAHPKCQR